MALKDDGTVVGWGNFAGVSQRVPSGLDGVVAISTSSSHSLAVKEDGTVVAWGMSEDGETDVPPGLTDVVAVAAGSHFSLALKDDGRVVGWGSNRSGGLNIPAGLTGVVAIDEGLALVVDNAAPTAGVDGYETDEEATLDVSSRDGVLANDADVDGNELTAQLVDDVDHGTLTLNADGSFTYTPEAGFSGAD